MVNKRNKKIAAKISLAALIIIVTLLSIVNSAKIKVSDYHGNQALYNYYLSLEKADQLKCDQSISSRNKTILEQISIFSIIGQKVYTLQLNQYISCNDAIAANNFLGIVKIRKQNNNSSENIEQSSFLVILIIAILVSLFIFVILMIFLKIIGINSHESGNSLVKNMVNLKNIISGIKLFYTIPDWCLCIQLVLFFGLYSILIRQDINWDLLNYHFYNGWALLNNRLQLDVTPNDGLHGYFSPILDSAIYFLIVKLPSQVYSFLMGAISGISAFICYKISKILFRNVLDNNRRYLLITCSTIISVTNAPNLMQIGTSTNETIVSLLVIYSIYVLISLQIKPAAKKIFCAGFVMGIAIGFKLTAVVMVVSVILAFTLINYKQYRYLLILYSSIILGFVITDGFWMFKMYQMFGNPIFPNFGKYINPNTAIDFQRDTNFIPKDLMHWLYMPFYLCFKNSLTSEVMLSDSRFAISFIIIMFLFVNNKTIKSLHNEPFRFSVYIFISGYFIWLFLFSIIRYTIVLGNLSGFIITYGLFKLDRFEIIKDKLIIFLTILLVIFTTYTNSRHISYKQKFYETNLKIRNSLIVFNDDPSAYIAPALGTSNIYINSPNFQFTSRFDYNRKTDILNNAINNHNNIYLVIRTFNNKKLTWLNNYHLGFNQNECIKFNAASEVFICKLIKS